MNLLVESHFVLAIANATQIIEEYSSEKSKIAFTGDLTYWSAWLEVNGLSIHEPIQKQHIILFIMQHAEGMPLHLDALLVAQGHKAKLGTHKIATVERRMASMSKFLNLKQMDNPCGHREILILIKKLKEKHGCSKAWGQAITVDILHNMLQTCSTGSIIDIRDAALILFGFSTGGRRRSEISSAMLENLTSGDQGYIYNLGKSKTNQQGSTDPKPLVGRAAIAMQRWIQVSGIKDGYLFRSMTKSGRIELKGLCDKQVARIIKLRCQKAGFDPSHYTAHSLRSGFVTEAGRRGKPIGDVMALTGHRSVQEAMRYYQTGAVLNNSAAYLAG